MRGAHEKTWPAYWGGISLFAAAFAFVAKGAQPTFREYGQAVAIWEKKDKIPLLADKHLRVIWVEHNNGNEAIKRVMDWLNIIERVTQSRIVLRETRTGWKSKVELEAETS